MLDPLGGLGNSEAPNPAINFSLGCFKSSLGGRIQHLAFWRTRISYIFFWWEGGGGLVLRGSDYQTYTVCHGPVVAGCGPLKLCWGPSIDARCGNPFPLIINDVPPPPSPLIINNPGGQKLFIIRGEYLSRGFGRAAFKFLLKSIEIKIKSKLIN